MSKNRMIIDTDCGTDDLLALMLAFSRVDWEILALTCCYGNVDVDQVCQNVLRLQEFCQVTQIPVFKGCDRSIMGEKDPSDGFHGKDGMGDVSFKYPLPNIYVKKEHAVNTLIKMAEQYPGEITLVTLGPLTNVAIAQRMDPKFSSNLKKIVIMGGNIRGIGNVTRAAEFNFLSDPEAASIVIDEYQCEKIILTSEVCDDHGGTWEWYEKWIAMATPKSDFIKETNRITSEKMKIDLQLPGFTPCDLYAMTVAIFPDCVEESAKANAVVELKGSHTRGLMHVDWRKYTDLKPNVDIPLKLNLDLLHKIWEDMVL